MSFKLDELGITKDDLIVRVVDRICDRVLDDDEITGEQISNRILDNVQNSVRKQVDEITSATITSKVIPRIDEIIEGSVLQETTQFGEPKGEPKTFKEYIAERADKYLTETVDQDGKPRSDNYNRNAQTRLAYLIGKHIHFDIDKIVRDVMSDMTGKIAQAIQLTAEIKLAEASKSVRVSVNMR